MLSKENIDKLCMTGLYKCEPVLNWIPSYKRDEPYWCTNWTFTLRHNDKGYFMIDTYFNNLVIKLDDDNIGKFKLIFDKEDVEEYKFNNLYDYDENDRWIVPVDSGGMYHPKCFIRKGAIPNKENVIKRIQYEIEILENKLCSKKHILDRIYHDNIDLRYV